MVREHELRASLSVALEIILYDTKAVVHFLLPDFSCVCVCDIVQYLVLGEEIVFNFDNLIVISIGSWVLCLLGACLYLDELQVKIFIISFLSSPSIQLSFFLSAVAKSVMPD